MDKEVEIRKLSLELKDLPKDWIWIKDPENKNIFIAIPKWFAEKLKNENWNQKDFQDYRNECLDLEIDTNLKKQ